MERNSSLARAAPAGALLLAALALPGVVLAADDGEAERESRRIQFEAQRLQEQGQRAAEQRERDQADALRAQQESIRRMEDTQARMQQQAAAQQFEQQLQQQAAEQARISTFIPSAPIAVAAAPEPARTPEIHIEPLRAAGPGVSPLVPASGERNRYSSDTVGTMNFATLSAQLRNYFGATSGVLVVSAGARQPHFGLQDGDVIISIDGRVPTDGPHVAGILRSYRSGERVNLRVLRDRRIINIVTAAPR